MDVLQRLRAKTIDRSFSSSIDRVPGAKGGTTGGSGGGKGK